jgi:hypothetical protein
VCASEARVQDTRVKQSVNRRKLPIEGCSLRAIETLRAQRHHFRQMLSDHHVGDAIRYSRRGRDKRCIRSTDVMPARQAESVSVTVFAVSVTVFAVSVTVCGQRDRLRSA